MSEQKLEMMARSIVDTWVHDKAPAVSDTVLLYDIRAMLAYIICRMDEAKSNGT